MGIVEVEIHHLRRHHLLSYLQILRINAKLRTTYYKCVSRRYLVKPRSDGNTTIGRPVSRKGLLPKVCLSMLFRGDSPFLISLKLIPRSLEGSGSYGG